MANYIGVKCPVCNKKFTSSDDIVVCPVCGAPHHRACYAQKSECAFASEHMSGKEWRAPAPDVADAPAAGACPSCGLQNPAEALFCQRCGGRLASIPAGGYKYRNPGESSGWGIPGAPDGFGPTAMIYGGLSPDEKIDGESARDLAVYIGTNTAYYLTRFKALSENPRKISFNFTALVFNYFYFFYRKMYSIGAFLLLLFIVGAVPSFLQAHEMMPQIMHSLGLGPDAAVNAALISRYQSMSNIAGGINFAIGFVMSFNANRIYLAKAVADIRLLREYGATPHDEIAFNKAVSTKGGVDRASVCAVVGALVVIYFIAVSVISYHYM